MVGLQVLVLAIGVRVPAPELILQNSIFILFLLYQQLII